MNKHFLSHKITAAFMHLWSGHKLVAEQEHGGQEVRTTSSNRQEDRNMELQVNHTAHQRRRPDRLKKMVLTCRASGSPTCWTRFLDQRPKLWSCTESQLTQTGSWGGKQEVICEEDKDGGRGEWRMMLVKVNSVGFNLWKQQCSTLASTNRKPLRTMKEKRRSSLRTVSPYSHHLLVSGGV